MPRLPRSIPLQDLIAEGAHGIAVLVDSSSFSTPLSLAEDPVQIAVRVREVPGEPHVPIVRDLLRQQGEPNYIAT